MKTDCIFVIALALFMSSCDKSEIEIEHKMVPKEWQQDSDKNVLAETTTATIKYSVPAGQAGTEWNIENCENSEVVILQGSSPITNNSAHEIIVSINFPPNTSFTEEAKFFINLIYSNFPILQNIITQLRQIEWEIVDSDFDIKYGLNEDAE